jgi:hypothetical protein
VVRPPSSFAITVGWPPSITETTEFVVPRSIPITLPDAAMTFPFTVDVTHAAIFGPGLVSPTSFISYFLPVSYVRFLGPQNRLFPSTRQNLAPRPLMSTATSDKSLLTAKAGAAIPPLPQAESSDSHKAGRWGE